MLNGDRPDRRDALRDRGSDLQVDRVAEAQAMGRPVVAPAHGAAGEIVIAGVTGWLFTPGDPVSLADALDRALALNQAERVQLAEAAIARAAISRAPSRRIPSSCRRIRT